jgi:hypothetical protein
LILRLNQMEGLFLKKLHQQMFISGFLMFRSLPPVAACNELFWCDFHIILPSEGEPGRRPPSLRELFQVSFRLVVVSISQPVGVLTAQSLVSDCPSKFVCKHAQ